jgi:nickel-dependent lactate racemase
MSAAARILKEDGLLILACECSDGVPNGSPYDKLLRECASHEEILARLANPGFVRPEQWQAQIQALIQRRARVLVKSDLPAEVLKATHLQPCPDITAAVIEELNSKGSASRVAVLPQGPLTIPYLNGRP